MARPRRFVISILACKKYKVLSALLAIYNLAVASASEDLIDIDPSSLAVSQSCESYKSASRALILNLRPSGGPRSSNRRTIMNTSSTTCSSLSTKHDVSLIARMKIKRNSPNLVAFAENHRPALPLVPCDDQPARVVAAGPGGGSQPGRGGDARRTSAATAAAGIPRNIAAGAYLHPTPGGFALGSSSSSPPTKTRVRRVSRHCRPGPSRHHPRASRAVHARPPPMTVRPRATRQPTARAAEVAAAFVVAWVGVDSRGSRRRVRTVAAAVDKTRVVGVV